MAMSLVKIPLLLLSSLSLHIGMTPPNQPPPPTEQIIPDKGAAHLGEVLLRRILTAGGPVTYFKILFWIAGIFESLLILSLSFPDIPCASIARSALVFHHPTNPTLFNSDLYASRLSTTITPPTPLFLVAAFFIILGGIIRSICFRTLGSWFTFELCVKKNHRLITSGPYSIVRHPSYTGAVFSLVGGVVMHSGRGSWVRESGVLNTTWGKIIVFVWFGGIAVMTSTVLMRIKSEEDILQNEFGDEWKQWKTDVRYKLFPWIY